MPRIRKRDYLEWKRIILNRLDQLKGKEGRERYWKREIKTPSYSRFKRLIHKDEVTFNDNFLKVLEKLKLDRESSKVVIGALKSYYGLKETPAEIAYYLQLALDLNVKQFIKRNLRALRRVCDRSQISRRLNGKTKSIRRKVARRIYQTIGPESLPFIFKMVVSEKILELFRKG